MYTVTLNANLHTASRAHLACLLSFSSRTESSSTVWRAPFTSMSWTSLCATFSSEAHALCFWIRRMHERKRVCCESYTAVVFFFMLGTCRSVMTLNLHYGNCRFIAFNTCAVTSLLAVPSGHQCRHQYPLPCLPRRRCSRSVCHMHIEDPCWSAEQCERCSCLAAR